MIDLHSHILPGLDDGARTIEHSREIAARAAADGITAVAATPHVRDDYPTTAEAMESLVDLLRRDFVQVGIGIEILHGGEIDLGRLRALGREELRRFTLAQTGRYLVVECPYTAWPLGLEHAFHELADDGMTAILAHPERNRRVQSKPDLLRPLVENGTLVQLTAASVDGRLGRSARRASDELLDGELAHLLASDAHTPDVREAGLRAAAESLADEALARWLTRDVPAAIVAGQDIPARPPRPVRRRRRLFLF